MTAAWPQERLPGFGDSVNIEWTHLYCARASKDGDSCGLFIYLYFRRRSGRGQAAIQQLEER
ncbi:hypothetical protein GQ600_5876 [Phytophthora cactorum]|nr:hypothetical protein GQ600_5876 [Phytophthora cactorum]